jgi:hypothetical protein
MSSKPVKAKTPSTGILGRPTKYKDEYCQMLIDHMSKGLSFESFAGIVSVNRDTVHEWVSSYADFSEAKKIGKQREALFWERLLIAGAAGQVPNYNAASVIFALKNKLPHQWKDKHEVVSNINVTHEVIRPQDVIEILKEDKFLDYRGSDE